jgi:hypothetical protein
MKEEELRRDAVYARCVRLMGYFGSLAMISALYVVVN